MKVDEKKLKHYSLSKFGYKRSDETEKGGSKVKDIMNCMAKGEETETSSKLINSNTI